MPRQGARRGLCVVQLTHWPWAAPKLSRKAGERWEGEVKVPISEGIVRYQYVVMAKTHRYEARIAERSVNLLGLPAGSVVDVQDSFRSPKPATLATSCFARAVFGKGRDKEADETGENPGIPYSSLTWTPSESSGDVTVRFALFAPRKESGHSVWVTGGAKALGSWSGSGSSSLSLSPALSLSRSRSLLRALSLLLSLSLSLCVCTCAEHACRRADMQCDAAARVRMAHIGRGIFIAQVFFLILIIVCVCVCVCKRMV